jgi:tripartite-type tricarboxylate transporter receptor subunit TctC
MLAGAGVECPSSLSEVKVGGVWRWNAGREQLNLNGIGRGNRFRCCRLAGGLVLASLALAAGPNWSVGSGPDCRQKTRSTGSDQSDTEKLTTKFPARAVRLVEPFGLGGGPDLTARALARELTRVWKVPVDVDNRPGAGSTLAAKLVAGSPPDGYTLLVNTSAQAYSAAVAMDLPYHPLKDFTPICPLSSQAYVFVTGRETGVSSVHDLIALAEKGRADIRFASTGIGTGSYVGASELSIAAGLHATHVPPLPGEAITDVLAQMIAGRAHYMLAPIPTALPAIRDGSLLALGVSTSRRSPLVPEIPAIAEVGVPKFDFPIWYGVWAPAATPANIVELLAADIQSALGSSDMRAWLQEHGAAPLRMTQPQFARFVNSESQRAARMIESGRN